MIDITPEGSIVPIYLEPMSKEQLDADAADRAEYKAPVLAAPDSPVKHSVTPEVDV